MGVMARVTPEPGTVSLSATTALVLELTRGALNDLGVMKKKYQTQFKMWLEHYRET